MGVRVTQPQFMNVPFRLNNKLERVGNQIGKMLVRKTKYNLNGRVLNKITGKLRDSIKYTLKKKGNGISVVVSSDVIYAPVHEYGLLSGRNGNVRMPERSFMRKALDDNHVKILKAVKGFNSRIFRNG